VWRPPPQATSSTDPPAATSGAKRVIQVEVAVVPGLRRPAPGAGVAEEPPDLDLLAEGGPPVPLGGQDPGDGRLVAGGVGVLGVEPDLEDDRAVVAHELDLVVLLGLVPEPEFGVAPAHPRREPPPLRREEPNQGLDHLLEECPAHRPKP